MTSSVSTRFSEEMPRFNTLRLHEQSLGCFKPGWKPQVIGTFFHLRLKNAFRQIFPRPISSSSPVLKLAMWSQQNFSPGWNSSCNRRLNGHCWEFIPISIYHPRCSFSVWQGKHFFEFITSFTIFVWFSDQTRVQKFLAVKRFQLVSEWSDHMSLAFSIQTIIFQ